MTDDSIKVVATLSRSAGNESVGEMWTETKVFSSDAPIHMILEWAHSKGDINRKDISAFRGHLVLTVAQ